MTPLGFAAIFMLLIYCFILFVTERKITAKSFKTLHYLRLVHIVLSFFAVPFALLIGFAGLAAHINQFYYNLNLYAICSYIPMALIAILVSRKLQKHNVTAAKFILLIPFINLTISLISFARI